MKVQKQRVNSISIPSSFIGAPGNLLTSTNYHSYTEGCQGRYQQTITIKTESSSDDSLVDLSDDESVISNRPWILRNETAHHLSDCFKPYSVESTFCPGKLKNSSDDICNLIQITKDILSVYGIKLSIDLPKGCLKQSDNLLKTIVSEIHLFPAAFFPTLKITQLAICQAPNEFKYDNAFVIENVDSTDKIQRRLYQIIFHHFIILKPFLLQEWEDTKNAENVPRSERLKGFWDLEDIFIALLKNENHALLKPAMNKLRELLVNQEIEGISEDWFKDRIKAKKRMLRVRFDLD